MRLRVYAYVVLKPFQRVGRVVTLAFRPHHHVNAARTIPPAASHAAGILATRNNTVSDGVAIHSHMCGNTGGPLQQTRRRAERRLTRATRARHLPSPVAAVARSAPFASCIQLASRLLLSRRRSLRRISRAPGLFIQDGRRGGTSTGPSTANNASGMGQRFEHLSPLGFQHGWLHTPPLPSVGTGHTNYRPTTTWPTTCTNSIRNRNYGQELTCTLAVVGRGHPMV